LVAELSEDQKISYGTAGDQQKKDRSNDAEFTQLRALKVRGE